MHHKKRSPGKLGLLMLVVYAASLALGGAGSAPAGAATPVPSVQSLAAQAAASTVVRVYFAGEDELAQLATRLDVWEVRHAKGYLLAYVSADDAAWLKAQGFSVREESRLSVHPDTIPGAPCYRTVAELEAQMDAWAAQYPALVQLTTIGYSYEGRPLRVMRLGNRALGGSRPVFFLIAGIHGRELITNETAMVFAAQLLEGYGVDADITWLLDYHDIYVLASANPDGHIKNEPGQPWAYWRKNTHPYGSCGSSSYGVDLNRNSSFQWGGVGSSSNPCDDTYRGPTAASETETQAVQNFAAVLFPDQRGPGIGDPAPDDATGLFITLHSYSNLVLWPWGSTSSPAPNATALQRLGRKMAFFNDYQPKQSSGLYPTTGATDDWVYGELGVAAYTYEMGSSSDGFYPSCTRYDALVLPTVEALHYAARVARAPYLTPAGPDALDVTVLPGVVAAGEPVDLTATLDDTRYNQSNGTEPVQNIGAAYYTIDTPPWLTTTTPITYPLTPVDGSLDGSVEAMQATIDTTGLSLGRHTVFVQGRDAAGNWGAVSAAFLQVIDPAVSPLVDGYVRSAATNLPLDASVSAGTFGTRTDPATGYYRMHVVSGTYTLAAEAARHAPSEPIALSVGDYQSVRQDFHLYPSCELFTDNVEAGNVGWTAQTPWAITTESSHSPTHSWTDSPGASYSNGRDVSLTSPVFDLSTYSGATLSFWHTYDLEAGYDYGHVEYSIDGGEWTAATAYTGLGHTTWTSASLALPQLDGQANVRLRFRLKTDGSITAGGWHVDDVTLSGGGPGCVAPLAPVADFTSDGPVALGEVLRFRNLTTGSVPLAYHWDFGDGAGSSTQSDPEYLYAVGGTFTVTLAVTNTAGSDSIRHTVVITPPFPGSWSTWVGGQPWTPGISVTVQSMQIVTVTDVISSSAAYTLSQHWDATHLALAGYQIDPGGAGLIFTGTGSLVWSVPASSTQFLTMTRLFQVEPCTWTHTVLQGALWDGETDAWQRPLALHKLLPTLHTSSTYVPIVVSGQAATLTVAYGNTGGYESAVTVRSVFPTGLSFSDAVPPATRTAPDASWAEWDVGGLATGGGGQIDLTLAVEPGLATGTPLTVTNTVHDHTMALAGSAPAVYAVGGAPTAGFVPDPGTPEVGQAVDFNNTTVAGVPEATSYAWDFGDGVGTSSATHPTYTYAGAGRYTVVLTATNWVGSSVFSRTLEILGYAPVAGFASHAPVLLGQTIAFTNTTAPGIPSQTSYRWDFGDGVGSSTAANPVYTYAGLGSYTVWLTATNLVGSHVFSGTLAVTGLAPLAGFSNRSPVFLGQAVTFTNTTSAGLPAETTYTWDFGDGIGSSVEHSPVYTYTQPGLYAVRLTATNLAGENIYNGSVEVMPYWYCYLPLVLRHP